MTARAARHRGHAVGHFGLVFVRPPVPGENGKSDTVRPESYEPEGRASSDHTHPSWAESFQAVLDDQDGICLFRDFLTQEGCTDLIDFWLACRGFQLARYAPLGCSSTWTDVLNKRRLKLAKAIYRKYIINNGVVGNKLRTVTKISLGERVRHAQLDSVLFLQAKQEVQDAMELEMFPVFLKSHVFLTYAQQTCTEQETDIWNLNSHKQETENDQQEVLKFLPDLGEKREWVESEGASANHKRPEHGEAGYKLKHRQCVKADAHEISSHHKVRIRRRDVPRDVHAEPHKFAADLISRLEMVQRESENWRRAEEHLHPVNMHSEGNVAEVFPASSLCPTHHFPAHRGSSHCDAHPENPDILLDRRKCVCERVTVVYYFCGEPIPYRTVFRGRVVTLAHFTQLLTKKGSYRFFFKKASDEFDCGVVYEEVCEDDAVLPEFQGKIIGKVAKI